LPALHRTVVRVQTHSPPAAEGRRKTVAHLLLMFETSDSTPDGSSFPVARVCAQGSSGEDRGTVIYLSPPCVSAQELEAAVDGLHRQLESILAEGRQRFSSA
jgi:hypothetical protein